MADLQAGNQKVIEDIQVRRTPRFNQAGGGKKFVYTLTITTMLGNAGTFEIDSVTYENDETYTEWLREAVYQLDKSSQMVG